MHVSSGVYFENVKKKSTWLLVWSLAFSFLFSSPARAEEDPFPGVALGAEIPGTRISSDPGVTQSQWEATSTYQGFSCPSGSGRGIGIDIGAKQWFAYCVKQWQPQVTIDAWADYRNALDAAQAAALAESQAWNAANPGKQKCVQWGPLRDPIGGESSGGVCANPVEPGPGTTVQTEEAPAVTAPAESTAPAPTPSSTLAPEAVSNSNQFIEDLEYRGSGYPFTKIYRGQLSTTDCPVGYQGANGLIAAIGTGTFTECWPENAWAAYRLGGDVWENFKSSGGTYDVLTEVRRRQSLDLLKQEAKRVAEIAANQTPGIQRCSRWTGYGESGTECAYAFVAPSGSSSSVDTNTVVIETSTTTSSTQASPNDSESSSSTVDTSTGTVDTSVSSDSVTVTIIPVVEESTLATEIELVEEERETTSEEDVFFSMNWSASRPELERRPL